MGTTGWVLVVAAIVALVGGCVWWARRREGPDEETYHFRCPGCRRRLRYTARQVGHQGACSNCGKALTFPPLSQALKEG
jgi:transcription initiation factor IIE alpha subunit